MVRAFIILFYLVGIAGFSASGFAAETPLIGVYYFPGWKANQEGLKYQQPWEVIKLFPEREPLLGWYSEGEIEVASQHAKWMNNFGVDFVSYDWYWSPKNKALLDHALRAFLALPEKGALKFTLLWANHSQVPSNVGQFTSMVEFWVKEYFPHPHFLKIDSRPVIQVFSINRLESNANKFGSTTKQLFEIANGVTAKAGYPKIYFVGGMENESPYLIGQAVQAGYSAITSYNYHGPRNSKQKTHSYAALDAAYRQHWNWAVENSPLPYFVPMTSGWNRKPWGGSEDPMHDNSTSTPEAFEQHLQAAKYVLDQYSAETNRIGLICCWNEFGEGTYVEPTKSAGFEYLRRIRKIFEDSYH